MLDRLVVLLQALLAVGKISEALAHLYVEPTLEGMLFDNQRPLIGFFRLDELSLVKVHIAQSHQYGPDLGVDAALKLFNKFQGVQ